MPYKNISQQVHMAYTQQLGIAFTAAAVCMLEKCREKNCSKGKEQINAYYNVADRWIKRNVVFY